MVNVDTVYQKVLTLSNKEQRGYITPQEFNMISDKAQLEIFESYFHDMKTAYHKLKNASSHSNEMDMLEEKMQIFRATQGVDEIQVDLNNTNNINLASLSIPVYKLDSIFLEYDDTSTPRARLAELTKRESYYAESNPLTKANKARPTYTREGASRIKIKPTLPANTSAVLHYWRKPTSPRWAYVVVNGKALYNYTNSVNFEIHATEEETLVTRILTLAGVVIEDQALAQAAMGDSMNTKREQND